MQEEERLDASPEQPVAPSSPTIIAQHLSREVRS